MFRQRRLLDSASILDYHNRTYFLTPQPEGCLMTQRPVMHIDIVTPNREGTARFYAELFGWEIRHDDVPYTWFKAENISGGFVDLKEGLSAVREKVRASDVILYLPSDDIEYDLQRVESLGGTVLVPKTLAGEGHYIALFTDPNGVRLGFAGSR
jgi:predicted enzyme related to lactoylglutathione lyase